MSDFYVGQKVVYVSGPEIVYFPKVSVRRDVGDDCVIGTVYEIRWIGMYPFSIEGVKTETPSCRLVGIKRNTQHPTDLSDIRFDVPFGQRYFRPLVEETKSIEIFRKIASDVTAGKHVIIPDDVPAKESTKT